MPLPHLLSSASCPPHSITTESANNNTEPPSRVLHEYLRNSSARLSNPSQQHRQARLPHAYSPVPVSHTSYPAVAPSISHHGTQRPLPWA